VFTQLANDLAAARRRDPAARSSFEVALTYPGVHALWAYRITHWQWTHGMKLLARWGSALSQHFTGVDIHPAAMLGSGIFIDHATGVVIGETAQVGDDVSLKLLLPLTVDGVNILPDGWPVHGRVSAVRPARRNCKPGKVIWKPNEITTPQGKKITISMDRTEKKAGKRIKKTVQYTALAPLVVLTLPFSAVLWGGMHNEGGCRGAVGEEERLPAGTALSAEVSNDITSAPDPLNRPLKTERTADERTLSSKWLFSPCLGTDPASPASD